MHWYASHPRQKNQKEKNHMIWGWHATGSQRPIKLFPNARSRWSLTPLHNKVASHHVEITFCVILCEGTSLNNSRKPPELKRDICQRPVEVIRCMTPLNWLQQFLPTLKEWSFVMRLTVGFHVSCCPCNPCWSNVVKKWFVPERIN